MVQASLKVFLSLVHMQPRASPPANIEPIGLLSKQHITAYVVTFYCQATSSSRAKQDAGLPCREVVVVDGWVDRCVVMVNVVSIIHDHCITTFSSMER